MTTGHFIIVCAVLILIAALLICISQVPRPFRRFFQATVRRGKGRTVNQGKRMDEALKKNAFKGAMICIALAFIMPILGLVVTKRNADRVAMEKDPAFKREQDNILLQEEDLRRMEEQLRDAERRRKSEGE